MRPFLPALLVCVVGCSGSDGGGAPATDEDASATADALDGGGSDAPDASIDDAAIDDAATEDATTDAPAVDGTAPGDAGTDATSPGAGPAVGPCRIFPADNAWNRDISKLPLHPKAADFASTMPQGTALHADWGTFAQGYGIPINVGTGAAPQKMTWTVSWGAGESDKLKCSDGYAWCYPIPGTAKIEGPSDSHLLFLDTAGAPNDCTLYELWRTEPFSGSGWRAANGAIFHLGSNALRPDGVTSADAAGLPILPGLVRWDEVKAGKIAHAIRFTMDSTYQGYIHPATHAAGSSNTKLPPMGLRLRLKASFPIGGYSKQAQVILQAMKTYGLILADNGSNWYVTGEESDGWKTPAGGGKTVQETIIDAFDAVHGKDFEPVDTGPTSTAGL